MATGCLNRIQKYLLSEGRIDQEDKASKLADVTRSGTQRSMELEDYQRNKAGDLAVAFKVAAIPPSHGSPAVLHDLNLRIRKESLTMIVGVVGAGKSTLLKAIIGELSCVTGTIERDTGHVAYCAQTPWLPNSTVRQIICGYREQQKKDDDWYHTVLHACTFDEDLQLLPDRDDTIIGSRGVTLSGGQKQRLVGVAIDL